MVTGNVSPEITCETAEETLAAQESCDTVELVVPSVPVTVIVTGGVSILQPEKNSKCIHSKI